ncbi:MAG: hypothetical protein ACLFN4_05040 [Candidatus Acetothermia bacterium]
MTKRTERLKTVLLGLSTLFFLFAVAPPASSGIFGIEDYPGGSSLQAYLFEEPDTDKPSRSYSLEVIADGDNFDVLEEVESPGRKRGDVSSAFGPSGAAGGADARYEEGGGGNIDLSPLSVIDERDLDIEENEDYVLPDGARLKTGEAQDIAEVRTVIGTFVHPNYPDQRVTIGFVDRKIRDMLVFPPLLEVEKGGEVTTRVQLTNFERSQ